MDWKSYYRRERIQPYARERAVHWLERRPSQPVNAAVSTGEIVSFPHTALAYAGPLQAELVAALYRHRVRRILALGVLHSGGVTPYRAALDEGEPDEVRRTAFSLVRGAFVPPQRTGRTPRGSIPEWMPPDVSGPVRVDQQGLLSREFSLDTFVWLCRIAADRLGMRPIPVLRLFVGMTRDPVSGSFDTARELAAWIGQHAGAGTVIVATGDVVHYGTPYGRVDDDLPICSPARVEARLRSEVDAAFAAALDRGDIEAAYQASWRRIMNDQRELLPVLASLLGPRASFHIVRFSLSDYATILAAPRPCFVASALIAYRRGEEGQG